MSAKVLVIGRGKREGYKLGDLVQNPETLSQVQLFCDTHGYSTEKHT